MLGLRLEWRKAKIGREHDRTPRLRDGPVIQSKRGELLIRGKCPMAHSIEILDNHSGIRVGSLTLLYSMTASPQTDKGCAASLARDRGARGFCSACRIDLERPPSLSGKF